MNDKKPKKKLTSQQFMMIEILMILGIKVLECFLRWVLE